MKVELLQITPNPEIFIATCASFSRRKKDFELEEARAFIRKLIKAGHESPLEHAYASFEIEGISRVCLAQLTRHRLASFTVQSQRHVLPEYDYVIPPSILESNDDSLKEMVSALLDAAQEVHQKLIVSGIPKEDARFFLPQAITTSLVMTANFREWRHIIRLRTAPDAQWEIRNLAKEIGKILLEHAPSVFEDVVKQD